MNLAFMSDSSLRANAVSEAISLGIASSSREAGFLTMTRHVFVAFPNYENKNTEFKIVEGDITEFAVEAIVNAANNELWMGGGVAGAIKRKVDSVLRDEALKQGPIEVGGAVATSAGALKSKYVIHAATIGMDFKTDELKVRSSCASALKEAERLKVRSIAFPALGCGVGDSRKSARPRL